MKNVILLIVVLLSFVMPSHICAQNKRIMLLNDYSDGVVVMKNKQKVKAKLNYDTANKKMMYLQNAEEMILLNNSQIDSVYISDRKFVSMLGIYLEVVDTEVDEVLIDWSFKNIYKGNRGAYGQVTQNKVESINTSYWTNNDYKNQSTAVYNQKNTNVYWFYIDNKPMRCRNLKDLLRIFPDKKDKINAFVKEKSIDFSKTTDAVLLIEYSMKN